MTQSDRLFKVRLKSDFLAFIYTPLESKFTPNPSMP